MFSSITCIKSSAVHNLVLCLHKGKEGQINIFKLYLCNLDLVKAATYKQITQKAKRCGCDKIFCYPVILVQMFKQKILFSYF